MPRIIALSTNRQTRTHIEIIDFGQATCHHHARWVTFCREHGVHELWRTRKDAEEFAAYPAAWCECCERSLIAEVDDRIVDLANSDRPWDDAKKFKLVRHDYRDEGEIIDPGVNFFVLVLEHLGARPQYSCEGHPHGFYVAFHASHELVRHIDALDDFFTIQTSTRGPHRPSYWAMYGANWGYNTERGKRYRLRQIAKVWQQALLSGVRSAAV